MRPSKQSLRIGFPFACGRGLIVPRPAFPTAATVSGTPTMECRLRLSVVPADTRPSRCPARFRYLRSGCQCRWVCRRGTDLHSETFGTSRRPHRSAIRRQVHPRSGRSANLARLCRLAGRPTAVVGLDQLIVLEPLHLAAVGVPLAAAARPGDRLLQLWIGVPNLTPRFIGEPFAGMRDGGREHDTRRQRSHAIAGARVSVRTASLPAFAQSWLQHFLNAAIAARPAH